MHIVSSPVKDYGNFELDVNAISLKSIQRDQIVLPYHGPLPKCAELEQAGSAVISFNLQPTQKTRIVLIVALPHKKFRRPLEASVEQICNLLDRFFTQKQNGLDDFCCGAWQADYASWRALKTEPLRMVSVLSEYSREDLTRILYYLDADQSIAKTK